MRRWFILSASGTDRPGLVAELAQLNYDCDANLEDSRMTILGTDLRRDPALLVGRPFRLLPLVA